MGSSERNEPALASGTAGGLAQVFFELRRRLHE